jgi:RimJ/RimL family protein N-acetyltransferase
VGAGPELRTKHLLLRRWRSTDLPAFAALNADPAVMELMPAPLSLAESAALIDRIEACFQAHGYGLWAVEVLAPSSGQAPSSGHSESGSVDQVSSEQRPCIGFVGLAPVDIDVPFAPAVEIGWRLARDCWGQGFATEAARAALAFGFEMCGLQEIVSFTAAANLRSRSLMERLGMRHDPCEDFDHPMLAVGDGLRRHVLYRLSH